MAETANVQLFMFALMNNLVKSRNHLFFTCSYNIFDLILYIFIYIFIVNLISRSIVIFVVNNTKIELRDQFWAGLISWRLVIFCFLNESGIKTISLRG